MLRIEKLTSAGVLDSAFIKEENVLSKEVTHWRHFDLNILNLFLNLDIVCTIHVEVKPMLCYLRFHTLIH